MGQSTPPDSTLYTWLSNQNDREQWQAFVTAAQEKDPEFTLHLEGPSFEDYWIKVKTRMTTDGAPGLLTTQAARTQEIAPLLLPLEDLAADAGLVLDDYSDAMMQGMTVGGHVRALPYDAVPMVLYVNRRLFADAGRELPPLRYELDRFVEDAVALTSGDVTGYAMNANFVGLGFSIGFANGADPTSGERLSLSEPAMVDALQFAFDLVLEHRAAHAPAAVDSEPAAQQAFTSGQSAMLVDGPWMYQSFEEALGGDLLVATIPTSADETRGLIQGSGFGVNASTPDPEAAFARLAQIVTPEVIGSVAAARGTYPSIIDQEYRWHEGKPEDTVDAIASLSRSGSPLVTTPSWNQVGDLWAQYATSGFNGEMSAAEIVESIETVVNP
ncbi:MAG: extracellular solute-binding protein [Brachybacterium sp.]|nr:extracellular solute-binding protein [Brachybacterium sp.]